MTRLDYFYVPLLVSAAVSGKLQEVYDPEKYVAGQNTWPDRAGDFRNMYANIERRGSGKSSSHWADLRVRVFRVVWVGERETPLGGVRLALVDTVGGAEVLG